ncbi:helix-turn-helix domain-containing protein [Cohnella herbarum]|uniref:Helix-turn-helix transcriptional regulator n=1 Tax=Cohnella herbarum TaxID=2728023 RepID=A0A7Z2VKA1_9BACL|nr:helix-turn-helix domain-containing protein [Cohnella herbarum]QJD84571.1 helix-turn-helix transcriptional regulator [Cohnella herbarum]
MLLRRNIGKGYTKLLAILLSIAIIPCLLISSLAYFVSINNAKKQAVTYSTEYLNLVIDSNTIMLQQAKSIIYEMMLNFDHYSDVLRNRATTSDAFNLLTALDRKKTASQAYVKSFYFIDNRSRTLIDSHRSSIYSFNDFPDRELVDLVSKPDGLLLNDLFSRRTTGGETVASYVVRYPLTGKTLGFLVVDLDMHRFVLPPRNPAGSGGHILITNGHGQLVNSDQQPWMDRMADNPQDYVVIRSHSLENGLGYAYAIPNGQITANNRILLLSIVSICAVLILLEAVAAWFSSRRLYTPLRNLMRYIRQLIGDHDQTGTENGLGDGDEYYYLKRVITQMNMKNQDYDNAFQANGNLFKQRQLSRLLLGETTAYRAMVVPDKFRLRLPYEHFEVMVMEIGDRLAYRDKYTGLEQELMLFSVTNIAEEVLNEYGEAVSAPLDSFRVAVLLNLAQAPDNGQLEEMGRKVQEKVQHYLKMSLSIGIGTGSDRRELIRESYRQALRALSHKVYYGKGSILSAVKLPDVPAAPRKLVSWNETKERLKISLQNGAWDSVKEQLYELSRTMAYEGMTEVDLQVFYLQYTASLSELCGELSVPFEELSGGESPLNLSAGYIVSVDELNHAMIALTRKLHDKIKDTKDHIHQELIHNILQYIREHLDHDLTLETIAEKVYMHPAYLSRICKSLTGKGLGEQIVHARVERAKQLLIMSGKSVNEISLDIGYTNPRAFYRLFKEYTGQTPGEFRKYESLKKVK